MTTSQRNTYERLFIKYRVHVVFGDWRHVTNVVVISVIHIEIMSILDVGYWQKLFISPCYLISFQQLQQRPKHLLPKKHLKSFLVVQAAVCFRTAYYVAGLQLDLLLRAGFFVLVFFFIPVFILSRLRSWAVDLTKLARAY